MILLEDCIVKQQIKQDNYYIFMGNICDCVDSNKSDIYSLTKSTFPAESTFPVESTFPTNICILENSARQLIQDPQQFLLKYFLKISQFQNLKPLRDSTNNIYYSPNWQNHFTGNGVFLYPGKILYHGSIVDQCFQGQGCIQYLQINCTYKGQFKNNFLDGKGTFQNKSTGQKFEGEWQGSKFKSGTLTLNDRIIINFQNFVAENAEGTIFYQDGDKYKGQISTVTYLPYGKGRLQRKDGSYSQGKWKQGKLHGKGKKTWKLENNCIQSFEGFFLQGKKQGKGIYRFQDGSYYEGYWKNDQMDGKGAIFSIDHLIKQQGIWKQGKLIKKQAVFYVNSQKSLRLSQKQSD